MIHQLKEQAEKEHKVNYLISPTEILADFCLHHTFGTDLIRDFENGINEKNVYLICGMFPKTPKSFWLNLQKNYDAALIDMERKTPRTQEILQEQLEALKPKPFDMSKIIDPMNNKPKSGGR